MLQAIIETSKGNINLNLFEKETPITVLNFVNLSIRGFYDNLTFHRVVKNFVIQAGCPLGNGTGSPGYRFMDECIPSLSHDKPGILSMANSGPDSNGSQFFITHTETDFLDGKHTVFGEVISEEDMKVVNSIKEGDIIKSIKIEGNYESLFEENKELLENFNEVLNKKFPDLR